MNPSVLWRAALVQVVAVAVLSLALALLLPDSFFDDWGWVTGPLGWLVCAAITARALRLNVPWTLLGAALAGVPSAIAVVAGVHWLGVAIAVAAFAAWCSRFAMRAQWT